jgi:hypothetical protein
MKPPRSLLSSRARGPASTLFLSAITWATGCSDAQPGNTLESDAEVEHDAALADAGPDAALAEPIPTVGADYLAFEPLAVSEAGFLELAFPLPAEARSFVLSASASQRGQIVLVDLQHADGSTLFARSQPDAGQFEPALTESLEPGFPLSVLYPSSPADPMLGAGRYRVRVAFVPENTGLPPAEIRLDVVWQARSEPTSLPVNVWLARGSSENAESLIGDSIYLAAFSELSKIFEPAGLALAPLQAFDLGPEGTDLSELDGDQDLLDLLAELEKTPASGLDFVLVDRIVTTGKTVRGKTTGIPGPPAHPQLTRRGAVVLAMESLPRDATRIAEAFAHEAAHYLGLRHTTELDGVKHDPIADTPECPIELASFQTTSGELLLSPPDCADYDGSNLLFPMPPFDTKPQHDLTPEQISVLRGSPLLR